MRIQKSSATPAFRFPRNVTLLFLAALLAVAGSTGAFASAPTTARTANLPPGAVPKTPENSFTLPDRIIVKMAPGVFSATTAPPADLGGRVGSNLQVRRTDRMFPGAAGARAGADDALSRFYVIQYDAPVNPFAAAEEVSRAAGVEYAEPWFIYPISDADGYTPNDSSFNLQWYIKNVLVDSAWGVTRGDSNVVIGFVDTGVETTHPDLADHLWINPGEDGPDGLGGNKRTNGMDDDGNGLVDDWGGWDFGGADYNTPVWDNEPVPLTSLNGHGSHVAGIACAVADNNRGIAGAGFDTRYLPVKATADNDNRSGGPFIIAGYEGIVYAAQMGVDIISLSWGGSGYSNFEQEVINYVDSLGVLVVAAAGNFLSGDDPTTAQYPASYNHVISVAAVNSGGSKSGYSRYNQYVDVSAPGDNIYSTNYSNTYGYKSGTSMATPLVAGVAALVKSVYPSLQGERLGERVRATCDDIYSVNSLYKYKIGKGRINAYRAVTETTPSVRMLSYAASDVAGGNGNGAFEPGEDIELSIRITNYLDPTSSGLIIGITSSDPDVVVTNGFYGPGAMGSGDTLTNAGAPYTLHVQPSIGYSRLVTFTLQYLDGGYSDVQEFRILFNPTFGTHTANNAWMTLTNNGRIGFQDFPDNLQGVGFTFNGKNHLFEGGLILGTSSTKLLNVVRNSGGSTQDADLTSAVTYNLTGPGAVADEEGSTYFADSAASATIRLGIRVAMNSYAYSSAPDDDYVITSYTVRNVSGVPISNFYAGLFMDWDMLSTSESVNSFEPYKSNKTDFDAGRGMGYAWYDTTDPTVHCGVVALEGAAAYRSLKITTDVSRPSKWAWISGGVVRDTTTGDVHAVVSSGPYAIDSGASRRVAFAIVGGNSLADLQANADAAIAKWALIKTLTDVPEAGGEGIPTSFVLGQNYPNPFNPSTTIRYGLPGRGVVRLTIYSILGEKIRTLIADEDRAAGYHEAVWDGTDDHGRAAASGVYLYRMDVTGGPAVGTGRSMKLILMR